MHTVRVAPADAWWAVQCDVIGNDMIFKSGARAELAAKRLALALAEAGELTKLEVHGRDGAVVGKFVCPPVDPQRRTGDAAPDLARIAA